MTHQERAGDLLPLIDEIVQQRLNDVATTHSSAFTKYPLPTSLDGWTEFLQSDTHHETRKTAVEKLYAMMSRRGNNPLGDPRDIENVLSLELSEQPNELMAYFVEVSIANVSRVLESLQRAQKALEVANAQKPIDENWVEEAQVMVNEILRQLDEAMSLYAKYRWLYEHLDDTSIQQDLSKTFAEIKHSQRGFLK